MNPYQLISVGLGVGVLCNIVLLMHVAARCWGYVLVLMTAGGGG